MVERERSQEEKKRSYLKKASVIGSQHECRDTARLMKSYTTPTLRDTQQTRIK